MVAAAWTGAQDADLILLVIDAAAKARAAGRGDRRRPREPRRSRCSSSLNKIDLVKKDRLLALSRRARPRGSTPSGVHDQRRPTATASPTSSARSPTPMPEGPWLYPEDEVSDATDRMIAAELTREQVVNQLYQELPYAAAVETETWEDRPGRLDRNPPADPGRARQPESDRDRQGRLAAQSASARRRARRSPSISAGRCTCSCTSRSTRKWDEDRSPLSRNRAGVGGLGRALPRPTLGTRSPALPDPAFVEEHAADGSARG